MVLIPAPEPNGNSKLPIGMDDGTLAVVRVTSPTPSPSRSRSDQRLQNGHGEIEGHGQDEDGEADGDDDDDEDGKSKQVKEGAYLKSKLWWLGLLLIATGEGGESHMIYHPAVRPELTTRQLFELRLRAGIGRSSLGDGRESSCAILHAQS